MSGATKVRPKVPISKDAVLRLKVISMGDGGTGKTSIIKRYCEEKVLQPGRRFGYHHPSSYRTRFVLY